jgi:hypothetical protein
LRLFVFLGILLVYQAKKKTKQQKKKIKQNILFYSGVSLWNLVWNLMFIFCCCLFMCKKYYLLLSFLSNLQLFFFICQNSFFIIPVIFLLRMFFDCQIINIVVLGLLGKTEEKLVNGTTSTVRL